MLDDFQILMFQLLVGGTLLCEAVGSVCDYLWERRRRRWSRR
jgi:hypothetical protein